PAERPDGFGGFQLGHDADMTMPSGTETSRPPVSTTRDELLYRLRQQSLLGEFGRSALQTRDMRQIVQRATELCAQGLEAPFAKVLEYIPDEKRLLIRAGVGWPAGTIDHVSLGADVESPAGYAFHTGKRVISNHLQEETRFRTPQLLAQHGVRRAINVLIARVGEGQLPFGVLEVDSADPGQFDRADADFLAGFAGLLGIAIERQQADAELQSSLDHQAMLTREMSHRVKNSLASVVGLLRVQARNAQSEDVEMPSRTRPRESPRSRRCTIIFGAASRSDSSTSPTLPASSAISCRKPRPGTNSTANSAT